MVLKIGRSLGLAIALAMSLLKKKGCPNDKVKNIPDANLFADGVVESRVTYERVHIDKMHGSNYR